MNNRPISKNKPNIDLSEVRILIVDDSAADRYLIRSILAKAKMKNVQEAESGSAAIFKIQTANDARKDFDLVISDWNMPGKNGMDLLKFIRSDKMLKHIAVIMVTSVADGDRVAESLKVGIDDFIVKPVEHSVLVEKVEKILFRRKELHKISS